MVTKGFKKVGLIQNKSYVLWLPSWYPNKLAPYNGDFIKRHAEAAALYNTIHVIHVVKDEKGIITKDVLEEHVEKDGLHEHLIYYYCPPGVSSIFHKFLSYKRYKKLYKKAINQLMAQKGKPLLAHLNVVIKAGPIALWLHEKYNVPFVITEHWTGFLKEENPNFFALPFYLKKNMQRVFKKSEAVSAVSNVLGEQLQQIFDLDHFTIIPNVVDASIFKFKENVEEKTLHRFLHISGLNYQKNIEGIIEAFAGVIKLYPDAQLDIIGPEVEKLHILIGELDLKSNIHFYKEMPQKELAIKMGEANAFIFFSRFETFGCVVIEANACGLPVIASDIAVLHETILNGFNGVFVPSENTAALQKAIISFIEGRLTFHPKLISEQAIKKYNYDVVGGQINNWYNIILNK